MIALKFLIVNRAWELSPGGWGLVIYIGVLFALDGTMILGSFFLRLKTAYLLLLMAVLLIGTELLVPASSQWGPIKLANPMDILNPWLILPGGVPEIKLWSNYPGLPGLELVIFGIAFGHWLVEDEQRAYRRTLLLGETFMLAFVVLRSLDGFGNIRTRMGATRRKRGGCGSGWKPSAR